MTNQEAIERLKAVRNYLCAGNPIWDVNEMRDVFELAISALQAQEETVSRKVYEQISWERDIAVLQLKDLGYGLGEKIRTDGDTISRQDAIDAITTWDKFGVDERSRIVTWHEGLEPYVHLRDVVTAIVNLPSAQPEIVRCKDCKRVHKYHDPFGNPIYVYVRVGDKTVSIKADDLQKALDYVTEHGEEVTIEGRGKAMVEELFDVPDAEGRADGN